MTSFISIDQIKVAQRHLAGRITRTPLVRSPELSRHAGADIHLKLEGLQPTGSFKVRGAFNRLLALTPSERERGVISFSTGNHGRAVAYAAAELGIAAAVCMSNNVPQYRRAAIAHYGAELHIHGNSQDEAEVVYERLRVERNLVPVPPFDDPFVIAGQGTIGLELLEDIEGPEVILVPVSGGGLASGVAAAVKSRHPGASIIAVSTERSPVLRESVRRGEILRMTEEPTLADALLGGLGQENRYTLRMTARLVDQWLSVDEGEIALAMRHAATCEGLIAEGAGAVGIAAILAGKADIRGKTAIVIISGRNADSATLGSILGPQQ